MKKQIFTIILLLMGGITAFGQFKLDGGVSSVRLQTTALSDLQSLLSEMFKSVVSVSQN